jgi:CubicO group peptidase (beta-lactamase class C family)
LDQEQDEILKNSLLSMPAAMLALVAGLAASCGGSDSQEEGPTRGEGDEDVIALLKPIREKYRLPAVSLAILRSDGIRKVGVVGVRKAGTDVQATLADSWHLGSDTKAMTATLLGVLVDQGRLAWTATMAESFPEMADAMDPVFRKVTLAHVLSHRAGLPANVNYDAYAGLATVQAQRLALAKAVLAAQPLNQPGSTYLYSNVGYIVAGALAERITGMDWESALQQYVTSPLGMSSVGFGGLGTPGQIDQPWGHLEPGKPVLANGPDMDNPPVVAPAGRVHSTIQDWALFIGDQLRGVPGRRASCRPMATRRSLRRLSAGTMPWAGVVAAAITTLVPTLAP